VHREHDYLDQLLQLHRQADAEERRGAWRQSIATLAAAVTDHRRAVPLEGHDPDELLRAVTVAMSTNLIDDLDWLSPPAAAAAIYELASALPPSEIKRDLGRRVLRRLHRGDAATFVALATRLALTSKRALSGASVRARVALSLDLPIGTGTRADGLALALISRRELSREWLAQPSTGSLPSRRLAARLLERAAREAAQRAAEGDDSGVRVFETTTVRHAWERLLAVRESLVWRHVAAARGLLSLSRPRFLEEMNRHLDTTLGITEWRRAAASVAASIAVRKDEAIAQCRKVLSSELFQKDRGLAAAMLFGLPRAAEAEPDAVEDLLDQLVSVGGLPAAEALVDLRRERIRGDFGDWAAGRARATLRERLADARHQDDGQVAHARAVMEELRGDPDAPTLRDLISEALEAFVASGAREASADAFGVLEAAERKVALLEQCTDDGESTERQMAFRALRELDLALLESDTLANLLALGARGDDPDENVRPLGDLFQRMTNWLVIHEGNPIQSAEEIQHFTLRMRRMRTLLHLVDADGRRVDDRIDLLRQRRMLAAQVLLGRVEGDHDSPLRRAVCAAAARASDALVRMDAAEVSDIVIAAGRRARSAADLVTMAEASMVPDIEAALRAYAELERVVDSGLGSGRSVRKALDALQKLARDLPIASSPRVEALRASLLDYARALEPVAGCMSLTELADDASGETPLATLEAAVQSLAKLVVGTKRRLGELANSDRPGAGPAIRVVDIYVDRALRGPEVDLSEPVASASEALREELPRAIGTVAALALARLPGLPLDAPRRSRTSFRPTKPKESPLPAWMPPSRTLGGFYVMRSIGTGAVGSVFVAKRSDARGDAHAEKFALKVPEYSGAAARTLSEDEFLDMFRQEAGALLSLPQHHNLARFVTFDAGVRPKPILVMELVEGPHLERIVEMGDMSMGRVLHLLDGVAAGLEAMHAVGVAHLDLKPSNVIVRLQERDAEAVLVDFGLAGRNLRPGCGTANYGAPEVWGHDASGGSGAATAADVYAFGCLAFELLTRKTLFEEVNDLATITAHLQHDGLPEPIGRLSTDPRTAGVAELVRRSIRRDPNDRVTMTDIRGALRRLQPSVSQLQWPISA